jgi:hypothetical protein
MAWYGKAKNKIQHSSRIEVTKMATEQITISPPNFQVAQFKIRGNAPYVQNKFSERIKKEYRAKQVAGSTAKKGAKREGKNFDQAYEEAKHVSHEGWCGIPAPAFRAAMVSACRTVGFKMTLAKLSVFVEADGFDKDDKTPLVKITKGEPEYFESVVRNQTGVIDLRARPSWEPGWEAIVRVRFDADQFTLDDVTNLLLRVGYQVGVGEGRPDSKKSTGMGWGTFEVINE